MLALLLAVEVEVVVDEGDGGDGERVGAEVVVGVGVPARRGVSPARRGVRSVSVLMCTEWVGDRAMVAVRGGRNRWWCYLDIGER